MNCFVLILLLGLTICVSTPASAAEYNCKVEKKFNYEHIYSEDHLKKYQFSIKVSETNSKASLSRCSFVMSENKVTCDKYDVDKIIFDDNVKIKKYYVFQSHFDMQIFRNLFFVENNGRGDIAYGKCAITVP